jgi:CDP-glucose 4,6-dehydratase
MNWKNKNVFVTGGDGFIGGSLAKRLAEEGANVVILVRDIKAAASYKALQIEDKVTQVVGDLVNYKLMARILHEYRIDSCFHLGAQALVQLANASPISTFESNIEGTWNVLEACRNSSRIERVVVASSDKAYGVQKKLPYTEDSPLLGLYPYDASKACTDILARSYAVTYKMPIVVTRNANTFGGGDLNFSRIIPDAIRCILQGREFIIRSDGTLKRDYMYIDDAVSAYLILAEKIKDTKVRGEAFNFGTNKPVSVISLFNLIAKLCGKPNIKPKIMNEAKNEIDCQYLASAKAKKILHWSPEFTLEEGLKRTISWYKQYLKI